jgi:hypothetical protein
MAATTVRPPDVSPGEDRRVLGGEPDSVDRLIGCEQVVDIAH